MTINQCSKLLNYLMRHGSINAVKARKKCGIKCLSARVCELRSMGLRISIHGDEYHLDGWRKYAPIPMVEEDDLFPEYTEELITNCKKKK